MSFQQTVTHMTNSTPINASTEVTTILSEGSYIYSVCRIRPFDCQFFRTNNLFYIFCETPTTLGGTIK